MKNASSSDIELQKAVWSALKADERLDSSQLVVVVERGGLHFSGTVPEMRMKTEAEEAVRDLPGIREIRNDLTVSVPPGSDDIGPISASEKIM